MFFRRLENREKLKKLNSEKGSERSSPFCFFFFLYRRSIKPQMEDGTVFHRTRRDKDNRCIVCHFLDWFTLGVWYRQRYFKRRHLLELCTEARHNELPCRLLLVVASVEHQNIQQNVSIPFFSLSLSLSRTLLLLSSGIAEQGSRTWVYTSSR